MTGLCIGLSVLLLMALLLAYKIWRRAAWAIALHNTYKRKAEDYERMLDETIARPDLKEARFYIMQMHDAGISMADQLHKISECLHFPGAVGQPIGEAFLIRERWINAFLTLTKEYLEDGMNDYPTTALANLNKIRLAYTKLQHRLQHGNEQGPATA